MKHLSSIAFTVPFYILHFCENNNNNINSAASIVWLVVIISSSCTGFLIGCHLTEKNRKSALMHSSEIMAVWICCLSIGNDCTVYYH